MRESIVILGASALQVPLIKYVKDKGYKTIVVSINGNYPGFDIADSCVKCDVRDVDFIENAISDENVKAVLTDQTDIAVPAVAELSQRLGLPANKLSVANAYSNKLLMRQACQYAKVSCPNFFVANSTDEISNIISKLNFPVIVKPIDNQGSRGVHIASDINQLLSQTNDSFLYSKYHKVIVEEFFEGETEYVVEGFAQDGEYYNFGIGERKYFKLDGKFIPSQTIFPAVINDDIKTKLIESEIRLHKYINPSFGMIHSEYLVNHNNNTICLVETALRGGGVYISSHLVPLYSDINNYDWLYNCAIGCKCSIKNVEREEHASAYICFYLPQGTIVCIEGVEIIKSLPFVHLADLDNIKIGNQTSPIDNKTMRLGPIIVSGEDRADVENNITTVQNTLKILVKTDCGIKGICWD